MTYGYTPPPVPKRKMKTGYKVAIGLFVFAVMALCCGGALSAFTPDKDHAATPLVNARTIEPPVTTTKATAPSTKAKPKAVTIDGDDIVHVGEDTPAGTYRTAEKVEPGSACYWMKSSDAEGENIIDNDIPSGGRPQVTLKRGQWFTTQSCPTWVKQ